MPKDHSSTQCNNCRAYGHLKKACPSLLKGPYISTLSIGTEETSKKEFSNSSPRVFYFGSSMFLIESQPLSLSLGTNINSIPKHLNFGKGISFAKPKSNIGSPSFDFKTKYGQEPSQTTNPHKKTDGPSKKDDDFKVLIFTDQDPALAHLHECDLCDEYGHYEYDCEVYLKAKQEQEYYRKNYMKMMKNNYV